MACRETVPKLRPPPETSQRSSANDWALIDRFTSDIDEPTKEHQIKIGIIRKIIKPCLTVKFGRRPNFASGDDTLAHGAQAQYR
jgi:hypothetical protein